jgi:hypothetical protein
MNIARVVHLHFNNNSGFWMGDQSHPSKVQRRARTVENPKWWQERLPVLTRFVLPSLQNAKRCGFEPIFFFRPEDVSRSPDTVKAVTAAGFTALFGGAESMLAKIGRVDGLLAVRLDTDDMISKKGWTVISRQSFVPGRAAQFCKGYAYGYEDGRLAVYDASPVPPAFIVTMYPAAALVHAQAFDGYRDKMGFNVPHYQVKHSVKDWHRLPDGCFAKGIGSAGTSDYWDNPHTLTKLKGDVKDAKKKRQILAEFRVSA